MPRASLSKPFDIVSIHLSRDIIQSRWQELEPSHRQKLIHISVDKIILRDGSVEIEIAKKGLAQMFSALSNTQITHDFADHTFTHKFKAILKKCRWESRLIVEDSSNPINTPNYNSALIKAVVQAHNWRSQLLSGEVNSARKLAELNNIDERFISRRIKLAYLAPDLVETILDGRQPADLSLDRLEKGFVRDWQNQKAELGFY